MSNIQRWLIIISIWIFAMGIFLHAFTNRYRLPLLYEEYAQEFGTILKHNARYDTWTGRLEVTYIRQPMKAKKGAAPLEYETYWKETPTFWVKDLK